MKTYDYDFLIVGSGLAGLYAAFLASHRGRVALLSKSEIRTSNSYYAQGGIASVLASDDSPELHFLDTMEAGRGLCDPDAVRVLVTEGPERVKELISLGMKFDSDNGNILLGLEGGHSRRRILHAAGDATGRELTNFMIKLVQGRKENVDFFQNAYLYQILSEDGISSGAVAYLLDTKESVRFNSPFTLLATGGTSGIYNRTTNPHTTTGDGLVLAYEAGCILESMEFLQFHPTALAIENEEAFLISEAVRGEGAHLVDSEGLRFMDGLHPLKELAPRDVVAAAIFKRMKETGQKNVFLRLDHLDAGKIRLRFSNIQAELNKHRIDLCNDLLPVAPAAHYMVGGIKTDINGFTGVKGLYAAGEAASTGVHGANRLASNSLLECLVFAKRATDASMPSYAVPDYKYELKELYFDQSKNVEFSRVRDLLGGIMMDKVGILRSEKSLSEALDLIENETSGFEFNNQEYYGRRLKSLKTLSGFIIKSALLRTESRGGHQREDYTAENADLGKTILLKKGEEPHFRRA